MRSKDTLMAIFFIGAILSCPQPVTAQSPPPAGSKSFTCKAVCDSGCVVTGVIQLRPELTDEPNQDLCAGKYRCEADKAEITISVDGSAKGSDTFRVCEPAVCGDGIVQTGTYEECDDGNTVGGDGCSRQCQWEVPPCDAGEQEKECSSNKCQGQRTIWNKLNPDIKRICYTCADPQNPCAGSSGHSDQWVSSENDSQCQGCVTTLQSSQVQWHCPDPNMTPPTVNPIYCCTCRSFTPDCAISRCTVNSQGVDSGAYCDATAPDCDRCWTEKLTPCLCGSNGTCPPEVYQT